MILVVNNLKKCPVSFFIVGIIMLFVFGCNESERESKNSWNPNIKKLEYMAERKGHHWNALANDVKNFYEALRDHEWAKTYLYRTKNFKEVVKEKMYIESMKKSDADWKLLDYEILNIEMFNGKRVRIIAKFIESPGPKTSYQVVWWEHEMNGWRCEEAGPSMLSLFRGVNSYSSR